MTKVEAAKLSKLRTVITENLRVQKTSSESVRYIDVSNVIGDVSARQNHAIFARRGCGKTLLLHWSARQVDRAIKIVYINCEDYKRHSFPNVLIEILDSLFSELETNLHAWFGRKRRAKEVIQTMLHSLRQLREHPDQTSEDVRRKTASEAGQGAGVSVGAQTAIGDASASLNVEQRTRDEVERIFTVQTDKIQQLDLLLPRLKRDVRDFFAASTATKAIFLQVDDLYHLQRADQAFVVDYLHRLCKDAPLYFKIATLRHATNMYVDRSGQPIGAQERHDYQPINIDYTFGDFARTRDQNRRILHEFGKLAGMAAAEIDALFKGEGFDRLIMAGGGVPRDVLSIFLEALGSAQSAGGDGRIGKDDIRTLSREIFERRIQELKQDSEGDVQDALLRGIYVLREFCLQRQTNIFVVSERELQQNDMFRSLIYRLLDYRIVHSVATALTHKSQAGTYQAFAIDIGCYAHLRKLDGRFMEIDVSDPMLKEKARSAPRFAPADLTRLFSAAPTNVEAALKSDPTEGGGGAGGATAV
jgi:hypothetical protein